MKNIIKKILPIIAITLVILFIFSINAFASPIAEHKILEVPDEVVELAKNMEEYTSNENDLIILSSYDNTKYFFLFLQKSYDYKAYLRCRDLRGHCKFELSKNVGYTTYTVPFNDLNTLKSETSGLSNNFYADGYEDSTTSEHSLLLYSTIDIYTDNTYTDFFFKVPILSYQIQEITKVEELPTMIIQTMKIILPIGLVIFGMLLLIWLIKSVILRAI